MFTIEAMQGSSSAKTNEAVLHAYAIRKHRQKTSLFVSFVDLLALYSG